MLQADILESSFALVEPRAEEFVHAFYDRLFKNHPEVLPLFEDVDMCEQQKKLFAALKLTINNVRKPDVLMPVLRELGARHIDYKVEPEHYPIVGQVLLETLEAFAGEAWTDEVAHAWTEAYSLIQSAMLEAVTA